MNKSCIRTMRELRYNLELSHSIFNSPVHVMVSWGVQFPLAPIVEAQMKTFVRQRQLDE